MGLNPLNILKIIINPLALTHFFECIYSTWKSIIFQAEEWWDGLSLWSRLRVNASSGRSTKPSPTGWFTGSQAPSCTAEYLRELSVSSVSRKCCNFDWFEPTPVISQSATSTCVCCVWEESSVSGSTALGLSLCQLSSLGLRPRLPASKSVTSSSQSTGSTS